MSDDTKFSLAHHPVHLGLDARVVQLEPLGADMSWYERYGVLSASDGAEGRLVMLHHYEESGSTWEVHPHGEELVVCLTGSITLLRDHDGSIETISLSSGDATINPRGVWHTIDIDTPSTVLFVTAGLDTSVRPR